MKFFKWVFGVLGLVGVIGGIIFTSYIGISDVRALMAAANSNKSNNMFGDPMPRFWMAAGALGLGGLLLGLGLGMPSKTSRGYKHEALTQQATRREAEIANRAASTPQSFAATPVKEATPEAPVGAPSSDAVTPLSAPSSDAGTDLKV